MYTTESLFGVLSQYNSLKETVKEATEKEWTCMELHQLFIKLPQSLKGLALTNGFSNEIFKRELISFIKADGEC